MTNVKFTKLTLEQNDLKVTWEVPYDDVNGSDMMKAIRTIMIGMTFSDKSVADSMASFLEEYYEYSVYDENNNENNENYIK